MERRLIFLSARVKKFELPKIKKLSHKGKVGFELTGAGSRTPTPDPREQLFEPSLIPPHRDGLLFPPIIATAKKREAGRRKHDVMEIS